MKGDSLMKEIQIMNFRSLKDTGMQKLSPITLLVGENSSGKSTFLRAFPLLKQSISKRTSGPILWAGDIDDYVDFGSFEETVTNDGSNDITFGFKFDIDERVITRRYYTVGKLEKAELEKLRTKIHYEITISSDKGKEYVSRLKLRINSSQIEFNLEEKSITTDRNYYYKEPKKTTPMSENVPDSRIYAGYLFAISRTFGFILPDIDRLWQKTMKEILHPKTKEIAHGLVEISAEIGLRISEGEDLVPLASTVNGKKYTEVYNNFVSALHADKSGDLSELFRLCFFYDSFSAIDDYIFNYFKQVHYIAPLRATAERYYRLRNLAVDEVDYQGKNLPVFINSLSNKQLKEFHLWTEEHFGFTVSTEKKGGHLSLQIKLRESDKKINLSDTGFGYSQVLPIITQLWELSSQHKSNVPRYYSISQSLPMIIAIEQPELHLHPAIQARLAKAFVASIDLARKNNCELQLIIETHSETIVNYFGRAIARGMLNPEDISLIMFEKDTAESVTAVKNSSYDKDGFLTNWPYGFFESED